MLKVGEKSYAVEIYMKYALDKRKVPIKGIPTLDTALSAAEVGELEPWKPAGYDDVLRASNAANRRMQVYSRRA